MSNIDKSSKFYGEILGLSSEKRPRRTARMRCGPDSLVIYEEDAKGSSFHFGFRIGSRTLVEEWKNWIARNGIKILDDISEKGHPLSFKFRDPDGYLIEISSKK